MPQLNIAEVAPAGGAGGRSSSHPNPLIIHSTNVYAALGSEASPVLVAWNAEMALLQQDAGMRSGNSKGSPGLWSGRVLGGSVTVKAVTAGTQHPGKPFLLPGPRSPHLFDVGRVAVVPCRLLACVPALRPPHVGSTFPSAPHSAQNLGGNPCAITLIARDRW